MTVMTVLSIIAFGSLKVAVTLLTYCIAGFGLYCGFTLFKVLQNYFYLRKMEKEAN